MTDPIRDALDWLNQRLLPTLFGEGVNAAFLQSWASHARAALAAQPPVGDDDDRAALQGLLDRVHLAATDPAAWLGLKQGDGQSPADAPPPAPEGDPIRAVLEQLIDAALAAPPPAPAASTTLDMDSLLRPEGAYQRGTGNEDGAQLVNGPHGPEWWAPLYGCDTLDNLLDRLRARILPHLRPPIAGIDVPGPDGDYGGIQELCDAEGVDVRIGAPLLKRARQAWRQTGRLHALQQEVHRFREPERTILCDILANGGLLPDPEGKRYGMPTPAPALNANALKEVFAKAIARDWSTGWATLADYVALAVEAQQAPSGNPPATEGSWDDAQRTVAERSHSRIAVSLLQLAAVNARQSRWLSSALCARAAELIQPASDGEREELARKLEDLANALADENLGGSAQQCRRAATFLRQPVPPPEGLSVMEYIHIDSGARIISEPSEECSGGCWIVRNSRHVNPCTEFRTVADAVAALHPAQGGDVQ